MRVHLAIGDDTYVYVDVIIISDRFDTFFTKDFEAPSSAPLRESPLRACLEAVTHSSDSLMNVCCENRNSGSTGVIGDDLLTSNDRIISMPTIQTIQSTPNAYDISSEAVTTELGKIQLKTTATDTSTPHTNVKVEGKDNQDLGVLRESMVETHVRLAYEAYQSEMSIVGALVGQAHSITLHYTPLHSMTLLI